MRYRWLAVMAVVATAATVVAQTPPAPVQLDPVNNKLDGVLVKWEQAMSSVGSLHTEVKRSTVDKIFGTVDTCEGAARYIKPNKASVYLRNLKNTEDFECVVCNGQTVYKWEPKLKEIQIIQQPKPVNGPISDDNFVSFMFGMKAQQAKTRYGLNLAGEDQHYYYIDVFPNNPADKTEFSQARLVLTKNAHLPAQLWFRQVNGNETTWDFTKMQTNVAIPATDFDQPVPAKGWQLKAMPAMK